MNDTNLPISVDDVNKLVKIDPGTLAIIVLAVVSSCCVLMMLALLVWTRLQVSSNLRCSRCHQVIAIQGVRLPPVVTPHYNVIVQPSHQLHHQQQQYQPQGHGANYKANVSMAASRQQPRSRNQDNVKRRPSHEYQNVPEIVVDQPDVNNIPCGDSATFQRLGMSENQASESIVSSRDAKALETRRFAMTQASPPDSDQCLGLEPLTPSTVSSSHRMRSHPPITPDQSSIQDGVPLDLVTPQPSKLQQVRVMNFAVNQTPCAVTPGHALKGRKSSLKKTSGKGEKQKTVTLVQPQRYPERASQQCYPLLEASELGQTIVTTGDVPDLLDIEGTRESLMILDRNYSSSNDSKTVTPGSYVPSPPGKANINTQEVYDMLGHYYPDFNQKRNRYSGERSPALVPPGLDVFVTSRGQELSPAVVMETHCNKIQDRRSNSSPHIVIEDHDKFVTDRLAARDQSVNSQDRDDLFSNQIDLRHLQLEQKTSPYIFTFDKNFDHSQPNPVANTSSRSPVENYVKRGGSNVTPSKIPIKKTYIIKTPTNNSTTSDKTPTSSEKKLSGSKIPRPDSSGKKILPPRRESNSKTSLKQRTSGPKLSDKLPMNNLKLMPRHQSSQDAR